MPGFPMTLNIDNYLTKLYSGDELQAEKAAMDLALLYKSHPRVVMASLDSLLDSPITDQRWWAVRVLAEIPGEKSLQRLLKGLGDLHADVRQCAALGLRMHPDARAIACLVRALSDMDGLVVQLAGDALIEIGKPAVPALLELMERGEPSARREAARSLAMIGDPRAIPILLKALDEDSCWMDYWGRLGLEQMGVGMLYFNPSA